MTDQPFPVRALLSEAEVRALIVPFPGDVSYSDYWRDYLGARDARERGLIAIRHAFETRTRYERPAEIETPGDVRMMKVLMLSVEAEALLMRSPGDDDPREQWELFHDAWGRTRAVARTSLERELENHRRATG